jgi:uncharacterized protein
MAGQVNGIASSRELRSEQCGDPDLLAALAAPTMYRGRPPVAVHETHASWVFVAGEHAYKIKKPLALGFLDYSTLSRRRAACREELRVNQALAPDIYLGVLAIVRTVDGFGFANEETAGAIEYAVQMRRFEERDTIQGAIVGRTLTPNDLHAVAERLASFHRAAIAVEGGGARQLIASWLVNIEELGEVRDLAAGWDLATAVEFGKRFVQAHSAEIEQRVKNGHVRDCHGDLRCEHVLLKPTVRVVDRIEFDPAVRHTDVAADLAFLTMDLEAHAQVWAARELVEAYARAGGNPGSDALRSFYAAERALVRAKVTLINAAEHQPDGLGERIEAAQGLWVLAERLCWRARRPLAIVISGPAASGKSVLASELSRRSEMEVVSSDTVRKRLADLDEHERARAEHYSARFTRATYEQLGIDALLALRRNDAVIVDATCRSRGDRVLLLDRLRRVGVTRLIVRCEAPLGLARERAARRLHDPQRISDATPQIAEEQFHAFEELDELPSNSVLRLNTTQTVDTQVAEVTRAVDRRSAEGCAGRQSP